MLHWLYVELWEPLWPNSFAPSVFTITAVIVTYVRAHRHHEQRHQELKTLLERRDRQ